MAHRHITKIIEYYVIALQELVIGGVLLFLGCGATRHHHRHHHGGDDGDDDGDDDDDDDHRDETRPDETRLDSLQAKQKSAQKQ